MYLFRMFFSVLCMIGFSAVKASSAEIHDHYILQNFKNLDDYILLDFANPKPLNDLNLIFISKDCKTCERDFVMLLKKFISKNIDTKKFIAIKSFMQHDAMSLYLTKNIPPGFSDRFYIDPGDRLAKRFNFKPQSDLSYFVVLKNNITKVSIGVNLTQPETLLRYQKEWQ